MTINTTARSAQSPLPPPILPSVPNKVAAVPLVIGGVVVGGAVIVESLIATGIVVLGTAVLYTATKELTKAISDAVQEFGIPYATDKAKQMRSALQIAYKEGSSRYGAGTAQAYRFMLDAVKQWIRGGPNAPVIPNQTKTIPPLTPQSESIQVKPSTFSSANELANQVKNGNAKAYQLYESVRQLDVWLRTGKGESTGTKRAATGKQLLELLNSMRVGGQPIPLAVVTPQGTLNFQVARVSNDALAITCGNETLHVQIKGGGLNFADTSKTIEAILEATGQFGRKQAPQNKVPPVPPLPIVSNPVPTVTALPTAPTAPTKTKPRTNPIITSPAPGGLPPNKDPKNTPPAFNRATVFATALAELTKLLSSTKNSAETDRAIEKLLDKIGWMNEQQQIDEYRSGRKTGRTGRESQRLSAALDAIDRMRVAAGTGGASSVTYDPSKAADFIIESAARYGKDLGISLAFTRELKNVLEQRLAGMGSNDPTANKIRQALRHLNDHEVLLQTNNTKLDALAQGMNSQDLSVRSLPTLELLYFKLSARAASSDLSPGQRTAYQAALDKILKEIKSRGVAPMGAASLNPLIYASAAGGELSNQQLRRIDQMLNAGVRESVIVSNLQAGWRPATAGVPQGKPTAKDQRLLFSSRSTPEIINSQALDPRVGKTLVVVSQSNKAQYEKIFANRPNVVVVAAFNKDEDPVNSLVSQGVMNNVRRVIAVGGAGQIDVAKGLTNHFSKGIAGDLVVVPTVISTTTLATPFVVTGVAANVTKAFSATTVIVPMKEMINDIMNIKDPEKRDRAFKAFAFNLGGGGGDLQGSISIQLQNLYHKPVRGKTALESLSENKFSKGAITLNKQLVASFPDIAKNDRNTLSVISRRETEAQIGHTLVEIVNQLFEYGNKATAAEPKPIEYLNNVVGAEHEFFNATNGTPLGKKANHGELVAMGTLMQARAYGELTKDFSVYNSLVAAYKKIGIPTSAADLASRGITVDEISVALAKSIAKNRLGDSVPNNLGGASESLVSAWNSANQQRVNEAARYKQLIERTFP